MRGDDEVRAVASVDAGCLPLAATSYPILLISFDVLLKLPSIGYVVSVVYNEIRTEGASASSYHSSKR